MVIFIILPNFGRGLVGLFKRCGQSESASNVQSRTRDKNFSFLIHYCFFQEEKLTISCCFQYKTFSFWQKISSEVIVEILSFILSLSSATSKTQTYFQHINVFMMLLTIIITMVMIRNITAVMIITKYSLPTVDFATRYSTRYSDFLLQPYSNPTRSQKGLLVGAWST